MGHPRAWVRGGPGTARAVLAGLFLVILGPLVASAATSGGWNNLGHGATASTPALNAKVQTLLRVGTKLYVGGDFTNAGGIAAADHIAVWDGTSWSALGGGLGDAPSAVYAIAVDGTHVYAAGSFQNVGGDATADLIAVFDGVSWHPLAAPALTGTPFALAMIGRTLYVGGGFDNAGGIPEADSIAAYDMDTGAWSALTDGNGDIGATVASIVPDGSGGLYVGGRFANADGIGAADYVARWTGGTSWAALGAGLTAPVRDITRLGSDVYVAGEFMNAGGIAAADKVARWTGTAWAGLGGTSAFGEAAGTILYDVLPVDGTVFVTGNFKDAAGDVRADAIAAFVNGSWRNVGTSADGSNGPVGLNGILFELETVGPRLYAGGPEAFIGGSALNGYAAWFRMRQPDALISAGSGYVGNGVYNTTGASQTKTLSVARGGTGTFTLQVTNDGLVRDTFSVRGPGSPTGFTASYFDGATNVTAAVVAGTYRVTGLLAGRSKVLTLKIKVASGTPVGSARSWLVSQRSAVTGGFTDAVRATVRVV
jgi:hypothetical protein